MKVWMFAMIVSLICPVAATATLIQVNATGTVDGVETGLAPFFRVGDTVNFSFVYDTTTPETHGNYWGAASNLNGQIGTGFTFMNSGASSGIIGVTKGLVDGASLQWSGLVGSSSVGTYSVNSLFFVFSTLRSTALGSDALTTTLFADLASDPTFSGTGSFAFGSSIPGDFIRYIRINYGTGGITSQPFNPAPIPEPSTMLLMGSGLAALAAWRVKTKA